MNRFRVPAARPLVVLIAAVLMTAAVAGAQTKIKQVSTSFAEQDVEIGTASAAEVDRQLPLVSDHEVQAYVNEIGQRLEAQAGDHSSPISSTSSTRPTSTRLRFLEALSISTAASSSSA